MVNVERVIDGDNNRIQITLSINIIDFSIESRGKQESSAVLTSRCPHYFPEIYCRDMYQLNSKYVC